jgi:hypothetical protein
MRAAWGAYRFTNPSQSTRSKPHRYGWHYTQPCQECLDNAEAVQRPDTSPLLSSPPPHHAMGRRHASASDGCRTNKWCPRTWQLRTRIKICRLGPEQRMCPCRVARACGERFSLAGFESHVASADGGTHAQCGCIGLLCTPPPPAAAALTSVRSVPWDR